MINYIYALIALLLILITNTVIFFQEIRKYYQDGKKLRKARNMYMSPPHRLPDICILCGAISIISLMLLMVLYLGYIEVEWAVLFLAHRWTVFT